MPFIFSESQKIIVRPYYFYDYKIMIVGWLNNMTQEITGFYRDKNYTGKEFKKICSTIFHSLVRDEKYLEYFIEMTENKNLKLEHIPEATFLNSIVFNWNEIKLDSDFDKNDAEQRAAFAKQVINSLYNGIEQQFQTTIKEEVKKDFSADEVKKATRNQKATLKYITDINENVAKYIQDLNLDISKKDAEKLSKILDEKGQPLFDKDKIFHKSRPFTEEEETEFKQKILDLAALDDNSKIATLKRKIDVFTANRRIYTHNNNEQPSIKKTAAAKKQGSTTLKELIFSIPKTQAVFYDQQILKDAVNDFIKQRYSDYNHFYVVHKDELRATDLIKLVDAGKTTEQELENKLQDRKSMNFSGDHVHLFVSGFDHEGNQNLIETEKKRITEFAKSQGIDIDFTKKRLTKLENKIYGQMKQQEFREHFNQYLEKAGLKIVKLLERHPDFDLKEYNKGLNQANKGLLNLNNGVNDYLIGIKAKREREKEINELDVSIEDLHSIENKIRTNIEDLEGQEAQLDIELSYYRGERIEAINEELRAKKAGILVKLDNFEQTKRQEIETKLDTEFKEKTSKNKNLDTEISNKEIVLNAYNNNIEIKEKDLSELNEKINIANNVLSGIITNNSNIVEDFEAQNNKIIEDVESYYNSLFEKDEFRSPRLEEADRKTKKLQREIFKIVENFDKTPRDIPLNDEEKGIFKKFRKETEEEIKQRLKQEIIKSDVSQIYVEIGVILEEQKEAAEYQKTKIKEQYKFKALNIRDSLFNSLFNKDLQETKKKLKDEEDKNLNLSNNIENLNNIINAQNNTITTTENALNDLRDKFNKLKSAFTSTIKGIIEIGQETTLKFFLNKKVDFDTLDEIKKILEPDNSQKVVKDQDNHLEERRKNDYKSPTID